MDWITVLKAYWRWHYTGALKSIYHLWLNFTWFFWHLFSIGLLARTLFAPWRRIKETYKGGLDLEDLGGTIITNVIMRIVGFFVRVIFIVIGLGMIALTTFAGVIVLLGWIFLPVVIIGLLVKGITLII